MRPRHLLSLVPLVALWGCEAPNGEFQNGHFSYECVGSADASCSFLGAEHPGPPPVVVGAPFRLAYDSSAGEYGIVSLEPASLEVMSLTGGVFTVRIPGPATVLARGSEGNIVDMLHVDAQPVAELQVFPMERRSSRGAPGTTQLYPPADGQPVPGVVLVDCTGCTTKPQANLFVAPTGAAGELLGGAVDYSWSVEPEGVVKIVGSPLRSTVVLEAVAPGRATVRIETAGFVKELPVRVEE